jgi:ankyrin repeat protein
MKKKRYISELKVLFSAAFILFTAEHCSAMSQFGPAVGQGNKSAAPLPSGYVPGKFPPASKTSYSGASRFSELDPLNRMSPLFKAIWLGDKSAVESLLDEITDINVIYEHVMTPLNAAVKSGNLEIVILLLNKGANIEACDIYGRTSLHYAIESGNLEMVDFLIKNEANIDVLGPSGLTVMHYAVLSGKIDLVRDKRFAAHINTLDRLNRSPLHIALLRGISDISLYLLGEYEGGVNANDTYGYAMLHYAVIRSMLDVVKKIVEKGGDVNVQDSRGNTPLHWAAQHGYTSVVDFLCHECNANTNVKNNEGQTPLDLLTTSVYNRPAIVDTLKAHNAKLGSELP